MTDRQDPGEPSEAEPVVLSVEDGVLGLVLDDGTGLSFDLAEFVRAVEGEQAPGEGARAA